MKHADLFVTGKDSAAAWVNGKQVLEALPLPPWKQAPWKTYLRQDVTSELQAGDNLLAVGVTLYGTPSENGMGTEETRPYPDERLSLCRNAAMGPRWSLPAAKIGKPLSIHRTNGMNRSTTILRGKTPFAYVPPASPMGTDEMGRPWQTGPGEVATSQLRDQQAGDLGASLCNRIGSLSGSNQRRPHRRPNSISRMG